MMNLPELSVEVVSLEWYPEEISPKISAKVKLIEQNGSVNRCLIPEEDSGKRNK